MKVAMLCLCWMIMNSAISVSLVKDDRLDALREFIVRPVSNRIKDEFDELRMKPSDTNINVDARLSFDKATRADPFVRVARKLGKVQPHKRKHISFRSTDKNSQNKVQTSNAVKINDQTTNKSRKLSKYHSDIQKPRNALGTLKFERKIPQIKDLTPTAPFTPERQLFALSTTADDKRTEQNSRFSQIYREAVSRAYNKYNFTQHLSHWSKDAVDDIHRLYLSGIKEVDDSKDFLIDKMDIIYNNFITPVRWNT